MTSNFFVDGGAAMMSDRMDWETPQDLYEELDAKYHFTLDPCCTHENAKCEKHYTQVENGLLQSWGGERVFCNPPYGRSLGDWVKKAHDEAQDGTLIVMLVPARTDTRYFHDWVYHQADLIFLKGRVRFEVNGAPKKAAPFPSMLVIYNNTIKED